MKRAITSSSFACSAGDSSMIRANVAKPALQRRGHSPQPAGARSAARTDSPGSRSLIRLDERGLALVGTSSKKRSSLVGK